MRLDFCAASIRAVSGVPTPDPPHFCGLSQAINFTLTGPKDGVEGSNTGLPSTDILGLLYPPSACGLIARGSRFLSLAFLSPFPILWKDLSTPVYHFVAIEHGLQQQGESGRLLAIA